MDYGLEEGEELPADIEKLTEAQYAIYSMVQTLSGTFESMSAEQIMGEKGSGLIVPSD